MARRLYCLLLYLATPLICLRLLWRSRRQPAYLRHFWERWGFFGPPVSSDAPCLWLHAVSAGETRAAAPLVEKLLSSYPECQLLLTSMTPTGREAAASLYGDHARIKLACLPYDYPGAMARFFAHFQPRLGVLIETELWPNLLVVAERRRVPIVLANARLSRRSARGYARIAALASPTFRRLAAVAAQSAADANRLARLGAQNLHICGNLKFDVIPDADQLRQGENWRATLGERPVWLAASTREGEETLLLDAYQKLARPEVLLLIVPRHPQRFDAVAELARRRGLLTQRRSQGLPTEQDQVWLGDSMGEMAAYYRLADWAFVGGSLLPFGGQNLIEAAACGCPALIGPHTFNFAQASEDALAAGAARRVADANELTQAVRELRTDTFLRARMANASLAFAAAHRGAADRVLEVIQNTLKMPKK